MIETHVKTPTVQPNPNWSIESILLNPILDPEGLTWPKLTHELGLSSMQKFGLSPNFDPSELRATLT